MPNVSFGGAIGTSSLSWTNFKAIVDAKFLAVQYDDDGVVYTIFAIDSNFVYLCTIWKGTVPDGVIAGGYSQATNDTDKSDFETNYKADSNKSITSITQRDPRMKRYLGNKTTTALTEVLVGATYTEPASQAQRSIVSTSANDTAAGSGAKIVRIEYLDSNYNFAIEDITMNGTTPVNTVSTTIRFIQAMYVISGTAAAGTITLKSTTGGGGTDVCVIASATETAFLPHYYCPAGKTSWIVGWGATCDDEASMKLKSQTRINNNLVDTNADLEKLFFGNPTPPTRLTFERFFQGGMRVSEKTYTRITVTPNQTTSTTTRTWLYIWEQ